MMRWARKSLFGWLLLITVQVGFAQSVSVIKYPALQQLLTQPSDSVLIVNFWATWCGPCVQELPYFEQLSAQYAPQKVKFVLVNLDGIAQLDKRVRPFLANPKRRLSSMKVLALDNDGDDSWISQLDPDWSGALPFTVMINSRQKQRKTFERSFTKAELEAEIKSISQ